MRIRLITALGLAAAMFSLTACRNSPQVAAYVGNTQISEARVTQLQDGYNKDKTADKQVPRNIVVTYLINDEQPPLHFQFISRRGACGKPRVVPHNRRPQARAYGNGRREMRVLSSTNPDGVWP